MREEDHIRVRAGLRAAIRDRLYALTDLHQRRSYDALAHHIRRLREDADLAGFSIVSGLTRALERELRDLQPEECLPVFLPYLTRSLALEPCRREAHAVLNLLLAGLNRRLAGAQMSQVA